MSHKPLRPQQQEIVVLPEQSVNDTIDLRKLSRPLKIWRWLILTIAAICAIGTTLYSLRLAPEYEAYARILIEKESPNVLKFEEVLQSNPQDSEYIETQITILQSRPLIQELIQSLDLAAYFEQQDTQKPSTFSWRDLGMTLLKYAGFQRTTPPLSGEQQESRDAEQTFKRVLDMLTITPVSGSRLLEVNARSTDRDLVAPMVNSLIDSYMERYLSQKLSVSQEAGQWLRQELEEAEQKVIASEAALQAYKEEYGILSVEDRQSIAMQKLSQLTDAAGQARIHRMNVEAAYQQLNSRNRGALHSLPLIKSDPLIRQLKITLLGLEADMTELLKTFRGQHPKVLSLRAQISSLQEQIAAEIQLILASAKDEYDLALTQEKELFSALEAQKQEVQELNQSSGAYNVFVREVESNRRIYETLLQRMKETTVTERLETSNIQVIERAVEPNAPVASRAKRHILLSLLLGPVLGCLFAFALELRKKTITTPEEFEHYVQVPCLGMIPQITARDLRLTERQGVLSTAVATVVLFDARSSVSEAYRGLRTHVLFSLFERERKMLLVTSSGPSEGKSSVVSNLGITLAQSGEKTLIVDCDFRRPRIGEFFHVPKTEPGLSDLVLDTDSPEWRKAIYHTDLPTLDIMPCGTIPPNPSELLGSQRFAKILDELNGQYDIILLDSPPVNAVTDPHVLSRSVNAVLFVVNAGKSSRDAIQYAQKQLVSVQAQVLGGVLNAVNTRHNAQYYGYQYSQYYHQDGRT